MKTKTLHFDNGNDKGAGAFDGLAEALNNGEMTVEHAGTEENQPPATPENKDEPPAGKEKKQDQQGQGKNDGKEKPASGKNEEEEEEEEDEEGADDEGKSGADDGKNKDDKSGDDKGKGKDGKTADEEEVLPALNIGQDEGDSNWADVSEHFEGMEKPKDPNSFAEFAENAKKWGQSQYEKGKAERSEIDLTKHSPESRDLIKALDGGTKYEDILNPVASYQQVLAGGDREIMEGFYTNVNKWDKEMVDDQLTVLEENGQLALEAKKVRKLLETQRDNTIKSIIQQGAKKWDDEQARIKKETEEDNKRVREAITKRTDFMGAKLTDQHRQALNRAWEDGSIKKEFENDPEAVVDFMLFRKFGATRYAKLKEKATNEAKVEQFKRHSNSADQGPSGGKNDGRQDDDNPWSTFEEASQKGVDGVVPGK